MSTAPEYPVTCNPRCYDLASQFLEDYPGLFSHANANDLGGAIQFAMIEWVNRATENYEPRD